MPGYIEGSAADEERKLKGRIANDPMAKRIVARSPAEKARRMEAGRQKQKDQEERVERARRIGELDYTPKATPMAIDGKTELSRMIQKELRTRPKTIET